MVIGYAIAKTLREENYKLILTGRREVRLKELQSDNVDILAGDLISIDFQDNIEKFIYEKYKKPKEFLTEEDMEI